MYSEQIVGLILKFFSLIPNGNNLNNKYIISASIVLIFVVLAKLIQFISKKYLEKIAARTSSNLDDLIIKKIKNPLLYLFLVYGFILKVLNVRTFRTLVYTKILDFLFENQRFLV